MRVQFNQKSCLLCLPKLVYIFQLNIQFCQHICIEDKHSQGQIGLACRAGQQSSQLIC